MMNIIKKNWFPITVLVILVIFLFSGGLTGRLGEAGDSNFTGVVASQRIVGNDGGGNNNSYIEGDTDTALFYVDAGNDRIGISTNSPSHVLDISSDIIGVGDAGLATVQESMTAATTTLCAITNPFSATTTIKSFIGQITTGTSTAATITLATSTSQFATSTSDELVADRSVGSGAQDTLSYIATSGENKTILGPSEYLLYITSSAGLGGYTYTGTCTTELIAP